MMSERVQTALAGLAGGLQHEAMEKLDSYASLLQTMGRRWNLMSPGALANLDEHLVDSAAVLGAVNVEGAEIGDLGSGAGLPGIVLAILRPSSSVTVIDSRRSKIIFLEHVVRRVGLANVRVVHERLQGLAGLESFDLAVSRALGSVKETLDPSLRLLKPGGRLVLYKGPKWAGERDEAMGIAAALGAALSAEVPVELPGFGRTTTLAVFEAGGWRDPS